MNFDKRELDAAVNKVFSTINEEVSKEDPEVAKTISLLFELGYQVGAIDVVTNDTESMMKHLLSMKILYDEVTGVKLT